MGSPLSRDTGASVASGGGDEAWQGPDFKLEPEIQNDEGGFEEMEMAG